MKVSEAMTAQVVTATPETPIAKVAGLMAQVDCGSVPILADGKIVGLVTDRDIVLRVVAKGGSPDAAVSTIMSDGVQTCGEDDNLADAAAKMGAQQIRRLVVLNEAGKLAGILSLGDIAVDYGDKAVGHTLEEISEPAAAH